MSQYYRNNPEEQIIPDWFAGIGVRRSRLDEEAKIEKLKQAKFKREQEKESVFTRPNESIVDIDSV